jgi:hypothetical protein
MKIDRKTANVTRKICDIEVDGIDFKDAPDFADAYISSASWEDTGESLTDAEIETLNSDSDFVYEQVQKRIY